jgi:hypothetical protein
MPEPSKTELDAANRRLDPTPGHETTVEEIAETGVAVAEAVIADVVDRRASAAAERRVKPLTGLLLAMLAMSLLLHAITLTRLFAVRNTLKTEMGRLADGVLATKQEVVTYNLDLDQQVPVNLSIPVRQSVVIPINTSVQIKQDITIPIDTGFGTIDLPVPLDVTIPINTEVPIEFNQDVPISTTLPIKMSIPIQLDLGSPQLSGYFDRLHKTLLDLRDQL